MPLILFTSPKGGVGKTTLTAHVAATLAARGTKVLALDLDPQNALRLHLGISIEESSGYVRSLRKGADWRASKMETASGVELLPFGGVDPAEALALNAALLADPALLATPVREMLTEPELFVVVDSAPGPSAAVAAIADLVDLAALVMLADAGSASLLPRVLSGRAYGRGALGARSDRAAVILNQVDLEARLSTAVMGGAAQLLGPRLLGAVCRDELLGDALAAGRLLTQCADGAAEDLELLVDKIMERLAAPEPAPSLFQALADWGLV